MGTLILIINVPIDLISKVCKFWEMSFPKSQYLKAQVFDTEWNSRFSLNGSLTSVRFQATIPSPPSVSCFFQGHSAARTGQGAQLSAWHVLGTAHLAWRARLRAPVHQALGRGHASSAVAARHVDIVTCTFVRVSGGRESPAHPQNGCPGEASRGDARTSLSAQTSLPRESK